MQESEKRELAEKNVALINEMHNSIKYFIGVSILFLIIDYLTSGGSWWFWVVGVWGAVLAFQWLEVQHKIRKNRLGTKEQRTEEKIQQEMNRIK